MLFVIIEMRKRQDKMTNDKCQMKCSPQGAFSNDSKFRRYGSNIICVFYRGHQFNTKDLCVFVTQCA